MMTTMMMKSMDWKTQHLTALRTLHKANRALHQPLLSSNDKLKWDDDDDDCDDDDDNDNDNADDDDNDNHDDEDDDHFYEKCGHSLFYEVHNFSTSQICIPFQTS